MGHIGQADAQAVVVGPHERVVSLQIDVVLDQHKRALLVFQVDAAGGVGEDDGADAHASEDADREGDFLCGIAFVEVGASLHRGHGDVSYVANDHLAGVADGSRTGECGDLRVGNSRRVGEGVGEGSEA
jgi:hypothetical protein